MPTKQQLTWFLSIVAVAEIALTYAMTLVDPHGGAGAAVMAGIMWAPGLVAMGVQLAATRSLRGMGWGLGKPRYLAAAYLVPMVYAFLPFLVAVLVGHGTWQFDRWAEGAGRWGLPATTLNGFLFASTALLLPGVLMGLGEEIGWRGFMVPKLQQFGGFWFVVNASYPIWLAFHLPGMFFGGYHAEGLPLWWSFLCFSALLYPGTVFFTWLRIRSGSVWPCALAHGAHNLFIQMLFALAIKWDATTPWLVGEFGALTVAFSAMIIFPLIYLTRPPGQSGSLSYRRRASA
jgi:uncharacterized protein